MQVKRTFGIVVLALTLAAAAPLSSWAQEAKIDSLEARIRELEARLDSLLAALASGEGADSAALRAAAELEALRAAAQAAAAEQEPPDTAQESRTRDLSVLNPEISVTGNVVGTYTAPVDERNKFTAVPREFEFGFESALDPYTRTKIFVSYEEELEIAGLDLEEGEGQEHSGFGIEEGYLYWVGLPANLGLKIGKFRQEIGLYNRWHTHALWEVDRPLPAVAFLGDDGLIQTPGSRSRSPLLSRGPALISPRWRSPAARTKRCSKVPTSSAFWGMSGASGISVPAHTCSSARQGCTARTTMQNKRSRPACWPSMFPYAGGRPVGLYIGISASTGSISGFQPQGRVVPCQTGLGCQ
jgi:hypothetical protein